MSHLPINDLGAAGELVGAVPVLVTLVYVAVQVRDLDEMAQKGACTKGASRRSAVEKETKTPTTSPPLGYCALRVTCQPFVVRR